MNQTEPIYVPSEYEIEVLKEVAGVDNETTGWGAAMGVSLGFLSGAGFITRGPTYKILPKGVEFLEYYSSGYIQGFKDGMDMAREDRDYEV